MRIAIASFVGVPPEFDDDERFGAALERRGAEVEVVPWDQPGVRWEGFDLVVIRSTWDYTRRRDEFLAWAEGIGARLRNHPALVRWNSDKRYLADLADAGLPVVATGFVDAGFDSPELDGEVVVKPTVSAGGRDTGRFGPASHGDAIALVDRITSSGRTAMIQPYLDAVDDEGEAAFVFIAGELAHTLRKRAVLRPDEVAPVRDDAVGVAEVMYDPSLVVAAPASSDEVEAAKAIVAHLGERFGATPLIARVDLARDPDVGPVLMELEAIEPSLYLAHAPASADRLAAATLAELEGGRAPPGG